MLIRSLFLYFLMCLMPLQALESTQAIPFENVLFAEPAEWIRSQSFSLPQDRVQNEDIHYLLYDSQFHIPRHECYFHRVYRLLKDSAVEDAATLEIDFDPHFETIMLHTLCVHRDGNCIDKRNSAKLKLLQQERRSSEHIYTGDWTAVFFLEDIREGDILEQAFTIQGNNPLNQNYFSKRLCPVPSIPLERFHGRVVGEKDKVFHQWQIWDQKPLVNILEDGLTEWIWSISSIDPIQEEANLPTWHQQIPWLQITTFPSWQSVAAWGKNLFDTPYEIPEELSVLIKEWCTNTSLERAALKAIRFVQNKIRYLSLTEDIDSYKAKAPNLTFQQRFGDCKDKTYLLQAILKEMGISSSPVLVHTSLGESIGKVLPDSLFNHAILLIKLKDKEYWIDPTLSSQGGDIYHLQSPPYKLALPLEEETTDLKEIPTDKALRHAVVSIILNLDEHERTGSMEVISSYYGKWADSYRHSFASTSVKEMSDNFIKFFSKRFDAPFVSKHLPIIEDDLESNKIVLKETYTFEHLGTFSDDHSVLSIPLSPVMALDAFPTDIDLGRKTPYALAFPLSINEHWEINLKDPSNLDIPDKDLENTSLQCSIKWSQPDPRKIKVSFHCRNKQDAIPQEELSSFRKQADQFYQQANISLTIPLKTNHGFDIGSIPKWAYLSVLLIIIALTRRYIFKN